MTDMEKEALVESQKKPAMSNRRILKNMLTVSVVFMLSFTCFGGLVQLESSINRDGGLGVSSTAVLYASMAASCLVLPKLASTYIGHKWCITLSLLGYFTWIICNGHATWNTMMAASVVIGVASAIFWTSTLSYITSLGQAYSISTGLPQQAVLSRMFGVFYCFFQMGNVVGSAVSSVILSQHRNYSTISIEDLQTCGVYNCPWYNKTDGIMTVPMETLWNLVAAYSGICIMCIIISIIFVDNLQCDSALKPQDWSSVVHQVVDDMWATVRCLRHVEMLLIVPLSVYTGIASSFFLAEWTESYISCTTGVHMVGWNAVITYAFCACIAASTGWLASKTGWLTIFTYTMVVDLGLAIALVLWRPTPGAPWIIFLLSAVYGLSLPARETQLNAFYGSVFSGETEAAFSNHNLWSCLGLTIGHSYSFYLCTNIKLYLLMGFLVIGMVAYYLVEVVLYRKKSSQKDWEKIPS